MPETTNGAVLKHMTFNGQKVKKWYHNGVKVYSAGNVVTYYVDSNASYTEEVDSEASCISPKTFMPTKSGWIFVGWREDSTASGTVLDSKIMGDEPVTLYAVFKQDVILTYKVNGTTKNISNYKYYNNGNIINPSFTIANPSISGATFKGWSVSSSSTTVTYSTINNRQFASSTTIYAVLAYSNISLSVSSGWCDDDGDPPTSDSVSRYFSSTDASKYSHIYLYSNGIESWGITRGVSLSLNDNTIGSIIGEETKTINSVNAGTYKLTATTHYRYGGITGYVIFYGKTVVG